MTDAKCKQKCKYLIAKYLHQHLQYKLWSFKYTKSFSSLNSDCVLIDSSYVHSILKFCSNRFPNGCQALAFDTGLRIAETISLFNIAWKAGTAVQV